MGMTRAQKQTEIEDIKKRLENSEILVVTQNKGLTVKQVTQLRNDLRKEGASFKVAKNTLVKIALKGTKFESIAEMLAGPVGIAAAHRPWLYTAIRPLLDLMQTIPTFVYLIPTLVLFGLGMVPGLISTVIFAIAAPIGLWALLTFGG